MVWFSFPEGKGFNAEKIVTYVSGSTASCVILKAGEQEGYEKES